MHKSKMTVGHDKTKLLVPSHSADSGADCTIRVAGKTVRAPDQLKLLSIALDKLMHFGAHCRNLRARMRLAQCDCVN